MRFGPPHAPDRISSKGGEGSAVVRPAPGDALATGRLRLTAAGDAALRAILDRLLLGHASAAEVAVDLNRDAQAVRHLLRRLVKGGLVERGEKSERRGVSEFLYSCDPRRISLSSDHLGGLPADQVERAVARVLRELFREAMAASESGSYFAREEFAALRFPLPLDEAAWPRATLLHERLLVSIAGARERALARLSDGVEPIEATAAILFFEIPGLPWPAPFADGERPSRQIRRHRNTRQVDAVAAHVDPLRSKIVDSLSLAPATAVELAGEIGAPLERVRYELRALVRAEMVKVHTRRERRGAIENVFIADNARMTFLNADVRATSDKALHDFAVRWTRQVFGGAVEGLREGSFRDGATWHLTRAPLRLDPQGFAEISASMAATLEGLFELRDECLARQADGGGPGRPAMSHLLLFEQANPMFERS